MAEALKNRLGLVRKWAVKWVWPPWHLQCGSMNLPAESQEPGGCPWSPCGHPVPRTAFCTLWVCTQALIMSDTKGVMLNEDNPCHQRRRFI